MLAQFPEFMTGESARQPDITLADQKDQLLKGMFISKKLESILPAKFQARYKHLILALTRFSYEFPSIISGIDIDFDE